MKVSFLGLCVTLKKFCKAMKNIISHLTVVPPYQDEIIVDAITKELHDESLPLMLERFCRFKDTTNPDNCLTLSHALPPRAIL